MFRRQDLVRCIPRRFVPLRSPLRTWALRVRHKAGPRQGVLFPVSRYSSVRVRKVRVVALALRARRVRHCVRANVARCIPLVLLPPACVRVEVWVDPVWLRRRLQDRLALRAVVPDSAMFLVVGRKAQ